MLKCRATLSAGRLELEVEWVNETEGGVWIAAALPRQAGSKVKYDALAADVEVDEQGRVIVGRWFQPMPEGMMREAPELPEWAHVPRHERYSGRMSVGWPLTRHGPYGSSSEIGDLGTPSSVVCQLGMVPAASDGVAPTYRADLGQRQTLVATVVVVSPSMP